MTADDICHMSEDDLPDLRAGLFYIKSSPKENFPIKQKSPEELIHSSEPSSAVFKFPSAG